MGIEDANANAGKEFSGEEPGQPVRMCGDTGAPAYVLGAVPEQLAPDSRGVYGFMPKPGTQFAASPPWPDWSNPAAVAKARATRLLYHEGMAQEAKLETDLRAAGADAETIARQIVELRNVNRMATYTKEQLPMLFERNLKEYGRAEGPTYEYLMKKKYKTPEEVIAAGSRTNPAMDVLTGIARVVPSKL
jgi:hypothetical protein